jgi:hypothetical protein
METWPKLPVIRGFTEIAAVYDAVTVAGGVICGGWVRYMVSPRALPARSSDVDVYCKDHETYEAVLDALRLIASRSGVIVTDVSTTFTKFRKAPATPPVQVIKPRTQARLVTEGDLQTILANFDFTICRAGLLSSTEALVDPDFEEDELEGRIRIKNVHCAFGNMMRVIKYAGRGYKVIPSDLMPLFVDWMERDESYRARLLEGLSLASEALRADMLPEDSQWDDPQFRADLYEMMLID